MSLAKLMIRETAQEHDARLGQVASTYFACIYSILVYDLILTWNRERKQVWKADWSPMKVLFLINRYWTVAALAGSLSLTQGSWSTSYCAKIYKYEPGVGIPMFVTAGMIMTLRAWSIAVKAKWVLILLSTCLVAEAIVMSIATTIFIPLPIPGESGPCIATGPAGGRNFTLAYWIAPMAFDLIATPVILIVAWNLHRRGLRSHLFYVFLRDQGIYFIASLFVNALNVAFYLLPDPALQAQNSCTALAFTSLLAQHLVLNLREESTKQEARSNTAGRSQLSNFLSWSSQKSSHKSNKQEQSFMVPLPTRPNNGANSVESPDEVRAKSDQACEQYPGIDVHVESKTFVSSFSEA